jgi:uncharacterized membrane protein
MTDVRPRLDALTDGLYGVAMTLLIVDIRVPEAFHTSDPAALLRAMSELWPNLLAYVISFFVLAGRWRDSLNDAVPAEVSGAYMKWKLVNLFFVTCVPLSTSLVGRFAELSPAVWAYAANMALLAATALPLTFIGIKPEDAERARVSRVNIAVAIAAAGAVFALSFVDPALSLLAFLLNAMSPALTAWWRRGVARREVA